MLAAGAVAGAVVLYDTFTTSLDEQKEKLDEVKDAYKGITNELSELESEIQSTSNKIKELENIPNPTWVDQEELDRLREVTEELKLQKFLKKEEQLKAAENLYKENKDTYEMEFSGAYGYSVNDVKEALSAGDVGIVQLNLENNIVDMVAALHYLEEEKSTLTDLDEIAGYDLYIDQITSRIEKSGSGYLSSLSSYKQNILEIASVRDLTEEEQNFYDSLSSMQKMIYEFYSPATWNNLQLDSIFDTEGIEKTKDELIAMAKAGELTPENIAKNFPKLYNAIGKSELILTDGQTAAQAFFEEIKALSDAINDLDAGNSKASPAFNDIFSFKDADNNATVLSDLKYQLSEVESAYQTCLSAKEEYEEQGYLSVDTLEKVLSLGDEYLQYLFDEEGNVRLDAEAFQELAQARINNLEAQALSNLAENIKQITDEETATEYLTQKQNDLAISYADVAANALMAMSSINGFSDSKPLQDTYNRFKSQYEQIKGLFANTRKGLSTTYSSSYKSDAVQTAKDAQQAAKDAQQATKDHIETYMDYMKKSLEAGRMDYQRYAHDVSGFLQNMYDDGKISAKEYFDYNKQMLEYQKSVMEQVLSAVDRRLEKEIDSYQDQIASVEERYQTELDYLDTVIQYYEDQKTALQDANDEIDRQLRLEQALYAFEMAQNQKTKKVYTSGSGFVYQADETAIKDASDDLRNAKLDMEIARLEEAIKQVENQQKALQDAMNAETAALEAIISRLEAYRDKWNEVAKEYEIAQDDMLAAQLLGADWENQIIAGRLETLNKFRDDYLAIQQAIVDAAWKSANEQIEAAKQAELKSQGQKGSGVIQTASTTPTAPANPAYWVYQTLGSYNTKGEASGKIGMLNGDEIINVGGKYLVVKWKNGYKSSGEASSKIVSNNGSGVYKRYHTGLKEGLVGKNSFDNDFSMVQKFGLKEYEMPAILKEKEAVLTEVQISNLADALRFVPTNNIMANVHVPDYSSLISPVTKNTEHSVVQNINVTLPNITNEAGFNNFKKEMDRLRLDAYQYAHRRHR